MMPSSFLFFSEALRQADFDTEVIEDGGAALIRLAETVPNIVIMSYAVDALRGFVTLEDGGYKPPTSQLRKS